MSSHVNKLKQDKFAHTREGTARKKLFFGVLTAGIISLTSIADAQQRDRIGCSVENGIIKYSNGRTTRRLELDVREVRDNPRQIYRNRNFTAIVEQDRLVVVIGARRALNGNTILGDLNGTITMSNSYSVPIREANERRIKEITLDQNDVLTLRVTDGGRYVLNLNNPFEWIIIQ